MLFIMSTLKQILRDSQIIFLRKMSIFFLVVTFTFESLQSIQNILWRNKGFMLMVLTSKP